MQRRAFLAAVVAIVAAPVVVLSKPPDPFDRMIASLEELVRIVGAPMPSFVASAQFRPWIDGTRQRVLVYERLTAGAR